MDIERGLFAPADVMTITGDAPVFMSPVTITELCFGAEVAREAGIRQKRLASLHRLLRKLLLTIGVETGVIFGGLAAAIKMAGRSLRFLTQNGRDFTDIPGLDVVALPSTAV